MKKKSNKKLASSLIHTHFPGLEIDELYTAQRKFPSTLRADLQLALEDIFKNQYEGKLVGLFRSYPVGGLTLSTFLDDSHDPVLVGPVQYDEVDTGEKIPARCLKNGLWLSTFKNIPFALMLTISDRYSDIDGVNIEIVVPPGADGEAMSYEFLENLEKLVYAAGSYKGKVISLEQASRYSGKAGSVKVHKLRSVDRHDVILPAKTLELLERNIMDFIDSREQLKELGMPVKKGLLFYGPPGTGKTHTIHYLANRLPEHTTLLITAAQVGLLEEYCLLARFLQPALIIIEDADLIARERESMNNPCAESLLNMLLNEMDGLREDASIMFILTTNRPEQIESALSSRPGRVDQAIEFPLPDEIGREKLIKLYSCKMTLTEEIIKMLVQKTSGATPAFIKELMRRAAQFQIRSGDKEKLNQSIFDQALEDMLFAGGTLNVKLLGGSIGKLTN
ncbi:MAG: 26S protease regulatory subunit [Cyanobacteria bacterium TGS_CYA1]|nr:26S protease regulatory subunit [Cyanobacteria bacterium TGS_CYA1]